MTPPRLLSTTAAACGPTQSVAKTTGLTRREARCSATGFRLNSGFGLPFGRPRWDARMTVARCSSAYLIVGKAARIRVSSVILPCSIGTLKSTRMKTRLPFNARS